MSDDAPLVLRDQPPVEHPVERPARFSQTFLQHADRCLRSAYLYLRHKGGSASHELARGTAFHIFMERITWMLIEQQQFEIGAERQVPPEVCKDTMLEVLRDHPQLQIPQDEQDYLRMMAWHVSQGLWLRPEETIAVERKFVLEVEGWTISGKVDYAWAIDRRAGVWDYKTQMNIPDQAEFEAGFQLPLYACGLAFGKLVREEPCRSCAGHPVWRCQKCGGCDVYPGSAGPPTQCTTCEGATKQESIECATCDGRGKIETLEPWPVLENAEEFELAEIYPAHLWERGLAQRVTTITRAELLDWYLALGATLGRVEHAFETGQWDAIPGHPQCTYCPASWECPLPARARNHAGAINSMEQAVEAACWWEFHRNRPKAVREEIKRFAGSPNGGRVRYGTNLVLEFETGRRREVDADGLVEAANRRAEFGEPFDPDDFIKVTHPVNFKRKVLTKAELAEESAPPDSRVPETEEEANARWGDDAPF